MHSTTMIVKTTKNNNGDIANSIYKFVNYAFDIVMMIDGGDKTTSTTKYR